MHLLVIRLSAMGDVAMSIPVLRVLLDTYPEVKITVVSRGFLKPLFADLPRTQFVEADVYGKHKGVLGLRRLAKEIKLLKIDAVADLHQVLRSKILSFFLKISGIRVAKIDKGRKEKKALTQANGAEIHPLKTTHQRYADVFADLGFPIDLKQHKHPQTPALPQELTNILELNKKYVGIAPFAAHQSKQYPLDLLEEVLQELSTRNDIQVLFFGGGEKEVKALSELEAKYSNTLNLAGKFKLDKELLLLANLDLMLSMDSGNGHLAALYNVPVVTIWGNTHPYAGFKPFNQADSNQLTADRTQFPLIPTSVYGNKMPEGYEQVMYSIPAKIVIAKILENLA